MSLSDFYRNHVGALLVRVGGSTLFAQRVSARRRRRAFASRSANKTVRLRFGAHIYINAVKVVIFQMFKCWVKFAGLFY